MYKQAVSAVELNGLEKISSYWIQKEVKTAMNSDTDNTDKGKALKAALSKKLQNMMLTSNDETINDEAESAM